MLDALKNALTDLLEELAPARYESFPRVGMAPDELPIELLAELGHVPQSPYQPLPRGLTPIESLDETPRGWTAN